MKYLRKITVLLTSLIFVAAMAIGFGVMFSVRNVNVTLLSYEHEPGRGAVAEIASIKENVLDYCGGTLISFVDKAEIVKRVGDGYTVDKLDILYPCTVNLTVKQRVDTFVIAKENGYAVYDENGEYLKDGETLLNTLDGAPNVVLEGTENKEDIRILTDVSKIFKTRFSSLRSVVDKVILSKAQVSYAEDKVQFVLRCGLTVEIQDYAKYTAEKIDEAFREFSSLTGEQKLRGTIYCYEDLNGNIGRTYNPN